MDNFCPCFIDLIFVAVKFLEFLNLFLVIFFHIITHYILLYITVNILLFIHQCETNLHEKFVNDIPAHIKLNPRNKNMLIHESQL